MDGTRERRVGRLRLKAADESQARHGVIILEDAFRTATLPCAESGRLLVVRSLALGKFRPGQSPAGVALLIERRVGEVRAQAVHALDPRADSRPAVYFHDETERYTLLASRLARGEDAAAWFWPAAVPGWKRSLPRDESLRGLLVAAARSRAGAAAAAALLGELLARGGVESLLGSLRWTDGVALLRACGWVAPAHAQTPAAPEEEASRHGGRRDALLARWAAAWGHDDARTLWLGATLLVAEKPARLLDARLTARAARLVELVTTRLASHGRADAEATRPAAPGRDGLTAERKRDDAGVTNPAAPRATHDAAAHGVRERERDKGRGPEEFRAPKRDDPSRLDDASRHEETRAPFVADGGGAELTYGGESESDTRADEGAPRATASHALGGVEGTTAREASGVSESLQRANSARDPREMTEGADSRPGDEGEPEGSGFKEAAVYYAPARTSCGGLFFLVPVMSRLGVAPFLEANPRLIELDFPRLLLRHVCERLRFPADDPVVRALGVESLSGAHDVREFVTPASWSELYSRGDFRLARETAPAGARSLADASGRFTLALWRGRAPAEVRELVAGRGLRRARARGRHDGLTLLLEAWTRAMRRWCRRRARVGLSELTRREGRLLATGTHVELFFDHRSADLRVRRAGLDLDPGWVAWLGRVVQFHYHNWEQGDGDF